MKHDAFDEALRRRAQREKSALSTRAEERVARAIREGQAAPRLMPGRRGSAIRLPSSGRGRNGRLRISRADVSPA